MTKDFANSSSLSSVIRAFFGLSLGLYGWLAPAAVLEGPCQAQLNPIEVSAPTIAPPRPIEQPPALPQTPVEPPVRTPRRAPNPFPGRPVGPMEDPKDIIARELYTLDPQTQPILSRLPAKVLSTVQQQLDSQFEGLSRSFKKRYRREPDPAFVAQLIGQLTENLQAVEHIHATAIEGLVRRLTGQRFGSESVDVLTTEISQTLPQRSDSSRGRWGRLFRRSQPVEPEVSSFFVFRRELYNLLAQGEGWNGMATFVNEGAQDLNAIHPHLADMYNTLRPFDRTVF